MAGDRSTDLRRSELLKKLNLEDASLEDLNLIQNAVLQRIATAATVNAAQLASGHDSHGSSHSKNSVVDLGTLVSRPGQEIVRRGGG
jgi:hypothetical protein